MDRRIAQFFGNLGEVHLVCTHKLFCSVNFHAGKIFNDSKTALLLENLLEMGAADHIIPADLLEGQMLVQMLFQIPGNKGKNLLVTFLLGGLGGLERKFFCKAAFFMVSAQQMNEEMFHIDFNQLQRTKRKLFIEKYFFLVRVVQPACKTFFGFRDNRGQEFLLCFTQP